MPENTANILIVEDELASLELLAGYFESESYRVYKAQNCEQAERFLQSTHIDLILMDIKLPDGDGLTLTRAIRAKSNVGIILVTQKNDDIDRILGLELGADDYVAKPYNARELLVRVRNLLQRLRAAQSVDKSLNDDVCFGQWRLLRGRRQIKNKLGEKTQLTEGEYKLLAVLIENTGQVLSREQIMNKVEGKDWNPLDRTIDVQIARLRKKLGDNKDDPRYINTAHGTGYIFIEPIKPC